MREAQHPEPDAAAPAAADPERLHAEQLQAREARFRALSDSSPLGIFHTDAQGRGTYTNKRLQELFGVTRAQSLGRGWLDTLHPQDRDAVVDAWRRASTEQIDFDMQYRVQRKDDAAVRHVHVRARPVRNAQGELQEFVGTVEDVTEQRCTLDRLAEKEELLRRLYESTPTMLHSIDDQGRLLNVSDTWLAKLGYTREEVIGRRVWEFLTPQSQVYARSVVIPAFLRQGRCDGVAYQMVTRSGEVMDTLLSSIGERDDAGRVRQSFTVIEDVTLRRRAERALEEEHRRLTNIIEGTQVGTCEWNVQTGEVRLNEHWAQIVGHTLADLAPVSKLTLQSICHPDDAARSGHLLRQHVAGLSQNYECELRVRHRLGHSVWVLARGRVMTWTADGRPEWMFGTCQDISRRKADEESMRASQNFLDRTGRLARVGGWEFDLASREMVWTDESCRIHGVPVGFRPTLKQAYAFFPPEARATLAAAVEAALAGGPAFDLELPLTRADGVNIWVRVVGSAEFAGGQAVRTVGAFQDMTERVAERLALMEANARVVRATESGGIGIWDLDLTEGSVIWDPSMYRLFDQSPPSVPATYALWRQHVHPEDVAAAEQAVQDAVDGLRPFDTEFRVIRADGSVRHMRGAARVTRDAEGRALRMVGTNWDITEPRRLAAELAQQHELLRVTLQSIGDAVITTDAEGSVNWLNPVAERLTGWLTAEARGRPLAQVFHILDEETRQPTGNPVTACLNQGQAGGRATHTLLVSRQGDEYGIEDSAAPIRNARGEVLGVVLVFHDVTEQRRLSGEMSYRASHDALTGLVNRAEFERRLHRLLDKAHDDASEHALLYIDLDQFKLVNDACGHAVGDLLLQQMAKLLGEGIRARDTLARLGGDEFAILLEHCSADHAQRVAQQICDRMDDFRFLHEGRRFRIGTSIGLVPVDQRWSTPSAVQQAADTSCYAAKEAGRNRVHVWFETDSSMRARHGETQWATRIEQALHENRFVLFAQRMEPLVPPGEAAPRLHAEVLLRLRESDGTLVPPGAFLPAAERFHLISRIDRWVLERAIGWMQAAPELAFLANLGVNLSGQSVGDRAFHRWASELLAQAGPEICRRLTLEITETAAVTHMAEARRFIEQVRCAGVRVALDDFGAGASSFGYLKSLPVDVLKIDGQFIRNLVTDPLDEAAVRCFVEVASVVGLKTVAEFVDKPEVLERLQRLGVDFAQGYLLHKPAPIEELRPGQAAAHPATV